MTSVEDGYRLVGFQISKVENWVIFSHKDSNLVGRLRMISLSYLGICLTGESQKSLPGWEFMMNGEIVPPPNGRWSLSMGGKCILVWKKFPNEESAKRDHHFLGNMQSFL